MARGQIEILFPLPEVDDPSTRAVYVDGMSNSAYGPGPNLGATAPGALPHQIATDTIYPASGGPSPVFDLQIAELGDAFDAARLFLNLLYYEFTADLLNGSFATAPGALQWGFGTSAYNVQDPTFPLADGDTGLPLGYDTNSIGIFDAVAGGTGYAAFGAALVQGNTGIVYTQGHTYGVAVDLTAHTAVYRDCSALLAGPPAAYATAPYGFTSTVYDLSPFGINQFHVGFSLAYQGGANKITFNAGGSAFVLAQPAGYSPWDDSGNTTITIAGTGLTLAGHNLLANDPSENGVIYGALSNTSYRLR